MPISTIAVASAVKSRFINGGQSCLAAKRFIVHRAVADEFTRRFAAAVADLQVGDPTDPGTAIGPMARADLLGRARATGPALRSKPAPPS
jgi:acyl-CoA reductase-like NAD-dependent aldehyde dehydrogenase